MMVGIQAGGLGSRLAEETEIPPKPMVEIRRRPIMRHIMKLYAHYGFRDFVIALGYKSEYIQRYFVKYTYYNDTNLRVDLRDGSVGVQRNGSVEREDWTLDPVETGYEPPRLAGSNVLAPLVTNRSGSAWTPSRSKKLLEDLWDAGDPPWRVWT